MELLPYAATNLKDSGDPVHPQRAVCFSPAAWEADAVARAVEGGLCAFHQLRRVRAKVRVRLTLTMDSSPINVNNIYRKTTRYQAFQQDLTMRMLARPAPPGLGLALTQAGREREARV